MELAIKTEDAATDAARCRWCELANVMDRIKNDSWRITEPILYYFIDSILFKVDIVSILNNGNQYKSPF